MIRPTLGIFRELLNIISLYKTQMDYYTVLANKM
jgi:hypothetical protein